MLAREAEPSRAPSDLPSRHDDGAVTAELHEVDLVCAGTEQNEVRDPEVEHQHFRTARPFLPRLIPPPIAAEGVVCYATPSCC